MAFLENLWFWIGVIAVTGIIAAIATNAINARHQTKRHIAEVRNGGDYKRIVDEVADVNARLLTRLDAVEDRLSAIEKLLKEIP